MAKKKKPIMVPMDANVHPVLKDLFSYCLYKSAMRIRGMIDTELETQGLIAPQCGILHLLRHYGSMGQMDLCREMSIDKATMVMLIDGLEELNFVKRVGDTNDRRVKFIEISKSGLGILGKISQIREKVEENFLEPLSAEERKVLRIAIPKLLK